MLYCFLSVCTEQLTYGSMYNIIIIQQPTGQNATVITPSGIVENENPHLTIQVTNLYYPLYVLVDGLHVNTSDLHNTKLILQNVMAATNGTVLVTDNALHFIDHLLYLEKYDINVNIFFL